MKDLIRTEFIRVLFSSFVALISKGYRSINAVLFVPVVLSSLTLQWRWITGFHAEVGILSESVFTLPPLGAGSFLAVEGELGSKCGLLQAAKDEEEMEEVVASSAVGVV